jgi:hypothetical protein
MKKTLMAIFALALSATMASAGVAIVWSTFYGIYDHTETDLVGGSAALLDSYSAIWQLIYAGADGVANPADWEQTGGANGDYVTGDDVVWAQREIDKGGSTAADGTVWDNWMINQGGNQTYEDLGWSTPGSVYQRIFEGTPGPNTWWGDSQLFTFTETYAGGGAQPDYFFIDSGTAGWQPTQQFPPPIPEPATLSLLGLGALALIRRKRS